MNLTEKAELVRILPTMSVDIADEILTLKEAAKYFKISQQTVRRMIAMNTIPFMRVGGRYRFSKIKLVKHFSQES